MPDAMTEDKHTPLTADAVTAWLKNNPNYLQRHPEVLDFLAPPKAVSGRGVVDFQAYMVQRLKADRDDVLGQAKEIVETSRANMNSQTRVHEAVLLLLDARTFEEFISTITMDFASILNVDIISLVVEATGKGVPQITMSGVRAVNAGSISLMMQGGAVVLESGITGFEEIYGGGAGLVKSQALIRLDIAPGAPSAMLAFGSRDPAMFSQGQGTELISFIGHVIARLMRLWLDFDQGS